MKQIYIAGSFRGKHSWEIHQNVLEAEAKGAELIGQGYAPIIPHKITENMQGLYPDETFLEVCMEWLKRSDSIYMLPGWLFSEGSREELKLAQELGLEVIYGCLTML